jgi:hypothetical protein
MINDFYLHLMDWSSLNHMAVALSAGVFIWNATDGTILQLCQREVEEEYVASVSWIKVTTFSHVNPDPHYFWKLHPDPHKSEKLDLDPYNR